jgi:hypothetical protein
MTYKLYPKARKFYGKVWTIFRNFMEIPPTTLGHHSPLLISLIPRARNFMELYGLFMEILWKNLAQSWAAMRHHGGTYGKFTDFYGKFYGKLMEWRIHKIRLLGPRIYKETPVKQLQFLELGQNLWKP